jgi:3-methyladenine DNA glycosylase/8-oxoguanine DNA glycosylase
MEKLYLPTPKNFSFKSTIYSHGWSDLRPFELIEKPLHINYVIKTSQNNINLLSISKVKENKLEITTDNKLNDHIKNHVLKAVNRMFRFEEDYSEFYEMAEKSKEFSWIVKYSAGRLLRCGSLWEDMVKMLCTTNCTWRLTQIMTENLVRKLGAKKKANEYSKSVHAFPEPQNIASQTDEYLRNEIKMGYRAPYLLEFANEVTRSNINLNEFEDISLSSTELYNKIRKIKGFGDYAASNLLKLLGRYDNMGADSWSSQKFSQKHYTGKTVDRKRIQAHYKKYGKWAGLFFWMDVSEDWYKKEIPW